MEKIVILSVRACCHEGPGMSKGKPSWLVEVVLIAGCILTSSLMFRVKRLMSERTSDYCQPAMLTHLLLNSLLPSVNKNKLLSCLRITLLHNNMLPVTSKNLLIAFLLHSLFLMYTAYKSLQMPCASGCCILIDEISIGLYWNIHGHGSSGVNDAAALAGFEELVWWCSLWLLATWSTARWKKKLQNITAF